MIPMRVKVIGEACFISLGIRYCQILPVCHSHITFLGVDNCGPTEFQQIMPGLFSCLFWTKIVPEGILFCAFTRLLKSRLRIDSFFFLYQWTKMISGPWILSKKNLIDMLTGMSDHLTSYTDRQLFYPSIDWEHPVYIEAQYRILSFVVC